ncbi:alpha/beta fold hydrolase [Pseudalkalibacillus sp. A8]|uniref:alpha/beta fold hydrolase n=1 Tax=Pseudalkalibacillus sp. A8 TaxID=3382641 RepID=UPI0038B66843
MFNSGKKSKLESVAINGQEITYDIHGNAEGPVLLLLSGWCQDHRLFDQIVYPLAKHHKVMRMNWRGHTDPLSKPEDFSAKDQADDVIGVLNALDIKQVIPVSTSHGGWANIEICERLGTKRVPQSVVIDWIMVEAGEGFIKDLQDMQDPERWFFGRQSIFNHWLGVSNNRTVIDHLNIEMASFGYDMWERSCRVIENAYRTWGSPLKRMAALEQKRPIVHIYSQAATDDYEEVQSRFIAQHPWFDFKRIPGETHFPTLESPEVVVKHIRDFVSAPILNS